jgi:ABC-type multidrug transport system fused ATPase/permease subunit
MSLSRLIEYDPSNSCIQIDSIPIHTLGLQDLRRKVTVVPQEPFLFKGSVRENLDPEGRGTDDILQKALESLGLSESMRLSDPISEGGNNLSGGQRQLLSLGRALVRKFVSGGGGLLILDEATASLDSVSDKMVQNTLQKVFFQDTSSCTSPGLTSDSHSTTPKPSTSSSSKNDSLSPAWTVITIAHRLKTIISSDMVWVMSLGGIIQAGSPRSLLERGEGAFYDLAVESGEFEELKSVLHR